MTGVSVSDLRQNLPSCLKRVQAGEQLQITSRGQLANADACLWELPLFQQPTAMPLAPQDQKKKLTPISIPF